MVNYPVIAVVNKIGNGKTTITTWINKLMEGYAKIHDEDLTAFSNYNIVSDIFKHVKMRDVVSLPKWLKNGLLTLDEVHVEGGDSYNFLSRIAKDFDVFLSPI